MIGNYIKAVAVAVSRSTAQLMKTGQTVSYRTGDDGDLEAGRNTSFTVLAENNPFGNTNRFTDELGGQTYTKNIVIDWSTYDGSTVLGYRRTNFGGAATWNQAIDGCLAVSISPFTSGWRLPNRNEVQNIILQSTINYSPLNITSGNINMWTSTSWTGNPTSLAYAFVFGNATITLLAKTSTADYIPCRTFTVTGTTLS
jgi:hypothetical protein